MGAVAVPGADLRHTGAVRGEASSLGVMADTDLDVSVVLPVYNETWAPARRDRPHPRRPRRVAVHVRDHRRRRRLRRRLGDRSAAHRRHPPDPPRVNRGVGRGTANRHHRRPGSRRRLDRRRHDVSERRDPGARQEARRLRPRRRRPAHRGGHAPVVPRARPSGSSASSPATSPRPTSPTSTRACGCSAATSRCSTSTSSRPGFSCVTTLTMSFLSNGYSVKYTPIDYFPRAGELEVPLVARHEAVRAAGGADGAVVQPAQGVPADRADVARSRAGKLVYDWIDKDFRLAANTLLILFAASGDHDRAARRPRRARHETARTGAAGMTAVTPDPRPAGRHRQHVRQVRLDQPDRAEDDGGLPSLARRHARRRSPRLASSRSASAKARSAERLRQRFPTAELAGLDLPDPRSLRRVAPAGRGGDLRRRHSAPVRRRHVRPRARHRGARACAPSRTGPRRDRPCRAPDR